MERFLTAKSGVYCSLLELLASEVYNKSNQRGTPYDLVTGEERKFAEPLENPSKHMVCTVDLDYDALLVGVGYSQWNLFYFFSSFLDELAFID